MSPAEAQFRDVEVLLDHKLSEFRRSTASSGLTINDLSARNYHYKNQVLSWSWQFVREIPVDGEIKRISLFLTYMEPLGKSDKMTILVRSEVFQQGQISRIDRKQERCLSIEQIENAGLEPVLKNAFERGHKLLVEEASDTPPPYVRSVAPGLWILKGAYSLLGELQKAPAVVATHDDQISLEAMAKGDEAGANIAEFLRNLGLPFFADKEWSPIAYVEHLKRKGLISGRFVEIYRTASGRWRLRDIE